MESKLQVKQIDSSYHHLQNFHLGITVFPLGLPGIIHYGVEKWMDEYVPFDNGEVFQNVYNAIFDAYAESLKQFSQNEIVYWCAVSRYKMVYILANQYYKLLTLDIIRKLGFNSVFFDKLRTFESMSALINESSSPRTFSSGFRALEFIRFIRQNITLRGYFGSLLNFFLKTPYYLIGNQNQKEVANYIKKYGIKPIILRPDLLYKPSGKNEKSQENIQIVEFVKTFFDKISSLIPDFISLMPSNLKDEYTAAICEDWQNFLQIKRKFSRDKSHLLMLSSPHNQKYRLVAGVWKSMGKEVIAFCHGNSYLTGINGQPLNDGTLLICDKYIVSSEGEKLQLEKARREKPSKICAKTEVLKEPIIDSKFLQFSVPQRERRKKISDIMIIGFPMDYFCYAHLKGCDTLSYTYLTMALIKSLKKNGYKVIYKAHPDTLLHTKGFFEPYVDEVLVEKFEEVYNRANCLFYVIPYTTTFVIGLASSLPVVYVDNQNWSLWNMDIKRLLDKRAFPLPVYNDENARLSFEEKTLLDVVRLSVELNNSEVVENFTN